MYQAIQTKFVAPTNNRPSRVKAWCEAGSITQFWNHAYDAETNHVRAANALAAKLGWTGEFCGDLIGGALPGSSGYAFVFSAR